MHLLSPLAPPSTQPFYDNSAISSYQNTIASGTAITWTQKATPGAYCIIAIASANSTMIPPPTGTATAAVTFGGTTVPSLGNVYCDNVGANGWIWVFGLANIAGGSSVTASVTLTETSDHFSGFACSFTYNNVSSVGALQTSFGSGPTQTLSVPSAFGNLIWGMQLQESTIGLGGFSLTPRQGSINYGNTFPFFLAGDGPGPGVGVNATSISFFNWAGAGLNML